MIEFSENMINKQIHKGYASWVKEHVELGYSPYFMSFMFRSLGGKTSTRIETMNGNIERVYSRMVTRFSRRPNAPSEREKLPLMIVSADLPVPKHIRDPLSVVAPNGGLHSHAMFMVPPVSRFEGRFDLWVLENHAELISDTHLQRIWTEKVTTRPGYVTKYAIKAAGHRLPLDSMLILPRERKARFNPTDRGYDEACRTVGGSTMWKSARKAY